MFGGAEKTSPRTFNQTQPFDRLVGSRHSFSFDLKSATDRWPLVFLFEVVQYLFDRYFASSVVNSAFTCNIFEVPFVKLKRRFSQVCFVAGQPLGYHGSWPTFALSHHILVWWCAKQVHPDPAWCTLYIVRGTRWWCCHCRSEGMNLNRLPSHVPSCYMRLNSQFVYVERDLRELKLTSNLGAIE